MPLSSGTTAPRQVGGAFDVGVLLLSTLMGDLDGPLGMGASVLYNLRNEKGSQVPQDWRVCCQALMNVKDPFRITRI